MVDSILVYLREGRSQTNAVRVDVAAWHATDAVRALAPQAGSTTHYIAMEDGGIWTVFFGKLDDDGGRFLIAYAAVQERDRPTQFNARKLDAAPKDAGPLLFRARAIQTARAGG